MRFKIASILTAMWSILQGFFLVKIDYMPLTHPSGWIFSGIGIALAFLLLTEKNLVRIVTLICVCLMIVMYGYYTIRFGLPDLIASLQPLIAIVLLILLFKPLSKNHPTETNSHTIIQK